MSTRLRALILEDNPADAELVLYSLRQAGFDLDWRRVETEEDYLAHLSPDLDVILSDYSLPQFDALGALARLQESGLDVPLIVVTGTISEEVAVKTIKQGAADYLLKDRLSRLGQAVTHALERKKQREEKQKAEEALRESEKRFHSAFESAPIGMALVAVDGRYMQVNRALCEIVGYSKEELEATNFQSITHPEDLKDNEASLARLLAGEVDAYNVEKRYLNKSRHPVWAHTSVSLVRDAQGNPLYFIAQVQDINDRKRAEEALKYRVKFEELISSISTSFINLTTDEIDAGINRALATVGEFARVDRSYVFLFSDEGKKMSNTHEWCAEGVAPEIGALQGLAVEAFPWWMEKLNKFENIHIPSVAELSEEASAEKEILQAHGIDSLIIVPLVYGKSLIGFFGFNSLREKKASSQRNIPLLKIVGEIIVNALERKRTEEALRKSEEQLLQAQKMESIGTLAG
ncbi:MAG TPA: PAS domain S-box protein, partial [Pyrinomonadaceae bacterium]